MSTKAIRQALRLMQEIQGHSTALTHAAALAEVEAIEKATKERSDLAEAVAEGDKDALEHLVQLAVDERNAAIARQEETK